MVGHAVDDELRRWRWLATDELAAAVEAAPDAVVPAYAPWTVRDLAVHVVRVYANARLALRGGLLQRPEPELSVVAGGDPAGLAAAIRDGLDAAEAALQTCSHETVWTPVGTRGPAFWARRLLREAVLHRWDAQQAAGAADPPTEEQALELIDEFLDTDVSRAVASGDVGSAGIVTLRAGARTWRIDLSSGVGRDGAPDAAASVHGEPAVVWLWSMGRNGLPGAVVIEDPDGSAGAFVDMIRQLNRPTR